VYVGKILLGEPRLQPARDGILSQLNDAVWTETLVMVSWLLLYSLSEKLSLSIISLLADEVEIKWELVLQ
jgi:hypothetical protein